MRRCVPPASRSASALDKSATHGRHEPECCTETGGQHGVRSSHSTAVTTEEPVEREARRRTDKRPDDRQPATGSQARHFLLGHARNLAFMRSRRTAHLVAQAAEWMAIPPRPSPAIAAVPIAISRSLELPTSVFVGARGDAPQAKARPARQVSAVTTRRGGSTNGALACPCSRAAGASRPSRASTPCERCACSHHARPGCRRTPSARARS